MFLFMDTEQNNKSFSLPAFNGKGILASASQFLLKSGHGLPVTILKQFKMGESSKLKSIKTKSYLTFNTILIFSFFSK